MKFLYKFFLYWTRFDIAIARSTGRNPQHIAALLADEQRWEKALWDIEHPLHMEEIK